MFIGRKKELSQLQSILGRNSANLVVINGRRRIGKSRLIKEFAKPFESYTFMGLPPTEQTTAQDQRDELTRQLNEQFSEAITPPQDWGDLFVSLAKKTAHGRVIVVLDEISWMASGDPLFLGKLKTVWDLHFSTNPKLVLILCGSVSAWIEKNILKSTGYLGRPTLHMTIHELTLQESNQFWHHSTHISTFEKLKILAVTGGVPRYLELINTHLSAEDNIKSLCFSPNGALYDEFKYIFSDIYGKRSAQYQTIVSLLGQKKASRATIIHEAGLATGGDTTEYLSDLELGGFISKEYTWSIKHKRISKLGCYRLKDNYTRFYLKYVSPNKHKIEQGDFDEISINNLPGWNAMLALQFENLVLNNRKQIFSLLNINQEDIIIANPYFQRQTTKHPGCQIDFMIQTKHDVIYVCEIKFNRLAITKQIITEMQTKMDRLKLPKYMSRRAVLIHVNGVSDEVLDEDFFSNIIDFSHLLNE